MPVLIQLLFYKFKQGHFGFVTKTRTEFQHPGVTAIAISKTRGNFIEQFLHNLIAVIAKPASNQAAGSNLLSIAGILETLRAMVIIRSASPRMAAALVSVVRMRSCVKNCLIKLRRKSNTPAFGSIEFITCYLVSHF